MITRVCAVGGGELGVKLDDETCCYLLAVIASDLGLSKVVSAPKRLPAFFGSEPLGDLRLPGRDFRGMFESLTAARPDADAYFFCLASLHKARLKYERILRSQPLPTIDQVGPRGLLQYGQMSPSALASLLIWRKWVFDIDNRAAQETGYIFEPIIAYSIGGVSVSARRSPVRRGGAGEGRQVDCLVESKKHAYEIKLRVTIAASGQGRWQEELDFPSDCKKSGYTPILVVLDPTGNPKLTELRRAFRAQGGKSYVGEDAWAHLEGSAGKTMGAFLEKYVRRTIQTLLTDTPNALPTFALKIADETLTISVGNEEFKITRAPNNACGAAEAAWRGNGDPRN